MPLGRCDNTNTWIQLLGTNAAVTVAQGGTGVATLGANGVLIGEGTSAVAVTGAGTAGQVLTSNGAGVDPTFQAASASFNPVTQVDLYEDFISGENVTSRIGSNGMLQGLIATGTTAYAAGTQNNPGLFRLNSHATNDNSGANISFGTVASGIALATWTNTNWTYEGVLIPGSNSTAITSASFVFGLSNSPSTDSSAQTSCIWIRHDSDLSDTTFVFAVGNASGSAGCNSAGDNTSVKTVASTITPSAGTPYYFKIRRLASGVGGNPTIYMSVNAETEKTFCSSGCDDTLGFIPSSGNLMASIYYMTRTTTGVLSGDIDMMHLNIASGLSRY